ncbi:MAG: glycosyltransferase family 4 protein [Bacteroidia bacterium]|nr:glycosyltransferase family 4 protein [Bacteroidia bacterium]MCZ2276906.1 glycosyltransferase family 4 protein [Bacteroidia bacterium]
MITENMQQQKRKVLHLFECYLPTAQNWAYRMLRNLKTTEVYIAALEFYYQHFKASEFNFIENPEYLHVDLLHEGKNQNVGIINRLLTRSKNRYNFAKYLTYLSLQIRENGIEVIHAHFANTAWYLLPLKKLTGKPFIVSFYGFDYESLPYTFPDWLDRYQTLFREADLFICEGEHGASILEKYGCPSGKIHIVRLGIDFAESPFFERFKQANTLKLVQVSNMAEKKGHIYSLQAFKEALSDCPDMTLTIVGRGNDQRKKELIAYCNSQDIAEKVTFFEEIPSSELHNFLKDYDVLIQPSTYSKTRDCEGGAPVIILDAQATGMPVISTWHCDIPDEVIHNATGLLSDERDVESLTNSIRVFYKMGEEEYLRYSRNARVHVRNHYDIKETSVQMDHIYKKFLSEQKHVEVSNRFIAGATLTFFSLNTFFKSVFKRAKARQLSAGQGWF